MLVNVSVTFRFLSPSSLFRKVWENKNCFKNRQEKLSHEQVNIYDNSTVGLLFSVIKLGFDFNDPLTK
jgi:hypothetical protein